MAIATREITLNAWDVPMSALLAEPENGQPRGVVVAVHGAGMRAGYFHGQAVPGQSLLELGASLGWTVLAVDRPGYGLSAGRLPEGQSFAAQAKTLWAALDDFASRYPTGAGFGLVAHSMGGKVALAIAACDRGRELIGLDLSGCGLRYAVDVTEAALSAWRNQWELNWGLLRHYPPGTFQLSSSLVAPLPPAELREVFTWDAQFPLLAACIDVPVRFTFAEQERWWSHGEQAVAEMTALFGDTTVRIDRQPHAGHNISLGWTARSYHLRALAFIEECLLVREHALPALEERSA